jgi:RNA polymerase sigma factor (sigma-70 family)
MKEYAWTACLIHRKAKRRISILAPDRKPDFQRIVTKYGDSLLRMCYLYLKDVHLAQDAVQETFLRVHKHYSSYRGDAAEKTWIIRIAINVCKNTMRTHWWRRVDIGASLLEIPVAAPAEPDDTLLIEIMKLPPRYKEVILLFYYQEMKIREIAEALGAPESTVAVRLKRARERLKPALKGWYFDEYEKANR